MRKIIENIEAYLCAILLLVMTVLGFANVLVRYLTSYSFAATQELLLAGFLLITIFGGALAARQGEHLAVTFFTDILDEKYQRSIRVIADIISVVLLCLVSYFCFQLIINQKESGVVSSGLQIPSWYYSLALPLGFLLIIIRLVVHTIEVFSQEEKSVEAVPRV